MALTNEKIAKILDDHCIPFYFENGHVIADSMLAVSVPFAESTDVTGYTKRELFDWLGY